MHTLLKSETRVTRFHVDALDLPVLSEQSFQVSLTSIEPEVSDENRPHRRNTPKHFLC
jgi:hypothetical protein